MFWKSMGALSPRVAGLGLSDAGTQWSSVILRWGGGWGGQHQVVSSIIPGSEFCQGRCLDRYSLLSDWQHCDAQQAPSPLGCFLQNAERVLPLFPLLDFPKDPVRWHVGRCSVPCEHFPDRECHAVPGTVSPKGQWLEILVGKQRRTNLLLTRSVWHHCVVFRAFKFFAHCGGMKVFPSGFKFY